MGIIVKRINSANNAVVIFRATFGIIWAALISPSGHTASDEKRDKKLSRFLNFLAKKRKKVLKNFIQFAASFLVETLH